MLNRCEFIGNLGGDPEGTSTAAGLTITKFKIACNWKTKEKEGTEWIPCVAFGKLADICNQYLVKGKQVYVAGKFKTNSYEKDGAKKYFTSIEISEMVMLGGKGGEKSDSNGGGQQQRQKQQGFDMSDDSEIPF